ncbi:MAG TPA: hypothetical protein VJZ27_13650, partial [Aggregatilineales bacterium]|nr:hypothetical protein [Aggregatilineales bacterium]
VILMVMILAAGYWLRSTGRNWDDYTHLHPDERFLTDVASRIGESSLSFSETQVIERERCETRYPAPTTAELSGLSVSEQDYRLSRVGKGGYFDAQCSDLNPNNIGFGLYVYGELPLFTTRITAETIARIEYSQCLNAAETDDDTANCRFDDRTTPRVSYNGIHLVGRMVSSVADTITILLVFLVGLKLFGRWTGILAAVFYAFAAFPIQQSHFWTVDAFSGTWVMLAIYAAVNVLDGDAYRPARFAPLAWMAAAVGVWAWELDYLSEPTIVPLVVYGFVFAAACTAASLATENQRNIQLLSGGGSAGLIMLLASFALGWISIYGLLGAAVMMTLLIMM